QPSTTEPVFAEGNTSPRKLSIHGLDGSMFHIAVEDATTVDDLSRIIAEKSGATSSGRRLVLTSGGQVLNDSKPLLQQLNGEEVTFVVRKVSAGEAALSLQRALQGDATAIDGIVSLIFGTRFDQSLEGVTLPNSLQTLTFGHSFNQSLNGVTLPSNLQTLTFGSDFNQSLQGVTLPSSLQSLTFGWSFNQSLKGVTLPTGLQTLTFGENFNQSLEGVTLPSSLQTLTFSCCCFNQRFDGVTLP
ncbi:Probable serine/threonine-protein kinase fnkA (FNIP repeat-containing protein A), partial [Durusdinium trenchii]